MDLGLSDRVVAITGATDGLGLALANRLLEEGALVGLCGRDEARLERTRQLLGPRALVVRADVTRDDDAANFLDRVVERFGRLDGLVNNAGRAEAVGVADSSDQQWRDDYELKVIAAVRLSRLALTALEATSGAILNVLAISARSPSPGSTPTSASRAAGLALTKALAHEVGSRGVRVNAVLIGLIESGQWARRAAAMSMSLEEFYSWRAQQDPIALGRFGRAEEFANVAAFLVSPRASYVTGAGLSIDGGLSPVI